MDINIITQIDWIARIIIAGFCGYLIGYERNRRKKNAGVRTHSIVSLSACLMIIVSKYGFMDVVLTHGITLDPSRIAAQIVSGVGFLGAGMIFVHNESVNGLTTAAGVWATAGIGMSIGSGLYIVGISATILILILQILSHHYFHSSEEFDTTSIKLEVTDILEKEYILNRLSNYRFEIINIRIDKSTNHIFIITLLLRGGTEKNINNLINDLESRAKVKSLVYYSTFAHRNS